MMSRTAVMGIVNVTPDSFSDGGQFATADAAVRHAYRLAEEGADVLDIGAESTRPDATFVSAEEEWDRLAPVLKMLSQDQHLTLSVDTYKAEVAARALDLGAHMINDVWGAKHDARMLAVVADAGCTYVWMHNRTTPPTGDGLRELLAETEAGIARCLASGIRSERLWIDPGIGFGKTYAQNLVVLRHLPEYTALSQPVLLGTSRKSVIAKTLELPVTERLEGSLATVAWGVAAGVKMVRVHDVLATVRTCRMMEAILHAESS